MSGHSSYCFIINCASNSFRAKSIIERNEEKIKACFPNAEFVYIYENDSIREIVSSKTKTHTHIVACGGDGTVNQTAHGLIGTNAILGVLPLGTGNDFARNIGLNRDFDHNLEVLNKGNISKIDVLKSEWGYTLNTFGIGVDGLTNFYASRSKFKSSTFRYFFAGLQALIKSKPFSVSIKTTDMETAITKRVWMITLANGKTEGGKYKISPDSINNDGKVEIIVVRNISRFNLVVEFLKLSFGFPFKNQVVETYTTTGECAIQTEAGLYAHSDGEQVYGGFQHNFLILKNALPVINK